MAVFPEEIGEANLTFWQYSFIFSFRYIIILVMGKQWAVPNWKKKSFPVSNKCGKHLVINHKEIISFSNASWNGLFRWFLE